MRIIIDIDERKIIDKIKSEIEDNDLIDTIRENFIESLNDDVLDDIDFNDCISVSCPDAKNSIKEPTDNSSSEDFII